MSSQSRRYWIKLGLLASLIIAAVFLVYLSFLYRQVSVAFTKTPQSIPTRLYSDLMRIVPGLPRSRVEQRLKSLSYSPRAVDREHPETLSFTLHPFDYPTYLLPADHPLQNLTEAPELKAVLTFENEQKDSPLKSIQVNDQEFPDLYLEPELIATFSRNREIRQYLKFQEIPAPIWKAIIAVEDQHFLDHQGLDPRGLARAVWVNLRTLSLAQGGSTITQQLVKNLLIRRNKNIIRKVNELFLALLLEASFDKEQILERYLNEVYLGQVGSAEVHGVAEGANHFFGKKLEDLNLAESALMAGLIRGPGYYSPYRYRERAMERQRWVLKKMVETGHIAEEEAKAAASMPIRLAPPQTVANKAPYFSDFVKAELMKQLKSRMTDEEVSQAGFRVYTTLDPLLNAAAQSAVLSGVRALEKRFKIAAPDRLEGALATVEHSTGYIRALVGGRSYAESTFNRILNMKRQIGSTFKPVVYLTALSKEIAPDGGTYGPARPVLDEPWTLKFDQGRQSWAPKNYEKGHLGWISMRTALAHSINTVAAKLGQEVGIPEIIASARKLGITSELPEVPSLALGVAELSPVELLRAYATLADHGTQEEFTVIRAITHDDRSAYARFVFHPNRVLDAGPVDLLTDLLKSVFDEGTAKDARKMGWDRPAAGKTGTTSNHRDAWFAGYTPELTTVVWVGMDQAPSAAEENAKNASPKKTKVSLTGAGAALPIWIETMKQGLFGLPVQDFPASEALTEVTINPYSGKRANSFCQPSLTKTEKYIRGHEPRDSACEDRWPSSKP